MKLLMITLSRVSSQCRSAPLTPPDLACGTGKYTHLLSTLGASAVTGYDISPTMISSALTTYPPSIHPNLHFDVLDCSLPTSLPLSEKRSYDLVFSAWFLNYAGTERELTNMFAFIEAAMGEGGRFVGVTTDAHDGDMALPKHDFYGLDIEVLEPQYVAPDTGEVVGVKAKVKVGKGGFEFDCFQFKAEVYERCARRAGLEVRWRNCVVPDDERRETGYWDEWLKRPTFAMLEARRAVEW
jgi:SAM-dependent methyltransferase